jgi:drug/metabolite transporter superfamily protein YnfA
MTEKGPEVSQREKLFGGLSVSALALGVLGALFRALVLTANSNSSPNIALAALGGILVVLSLVFGVLGRRTREGRLGMIGSGTLLIVVFGLTAFLFSRHVVAPVEPASVPSLSLPPR